MPRGRAGVLGEGQEVRKRGKKGSGSMNGPKGTGGRAEPMGGGETRYHTAEGQPSLGDGRKGATSHRRWE